MYDKIKISGKIVVLTGLHIGGSDQYSAIGSVDSPVIKDTLSNLPIIPGSSLKGKMRTLLAKYYSENNILNEPNEDPDEVLYLFGSFKKEKKGQESRIIKGRLQFMDAKLSNLSELKQRMVDSAVEVKFENTIKRLTAEANPRQIERVIPESKFEFEIMYDAWFEESGYEEAKNLIQDDFDIIGNGMKLLQLDYLGGNGTRGYGKIKFIDLSVKHVFGESKEIDTEGLLKKLNDKIK